MPDLGTLRETGAPLFPGFFMAGFEGSTHRRRDGVQLDMIRRTRHDLQAAEDYALLASCGIATVRDAVRWHRVEQWPGRYDWASLLPLVEAARTNGIRVIWDLCHYGVPRGLDIFGDEFVERFAAFAGAAAAFLRAEMDGPLVCCPVNEISFWAWAGGDQGRMDPCTTRRGGVLKRQLVRAAIAATDAVRRVDPQARFLQCEPLIHVVGRAGRTDEAAAAEAYRQAQFEACDMLAGRIAPELGGSAEHLDIVGLNFYPDNQWVRPDTTLPMGHDRYRPLADMLAEVFQRYGRPMLLSETGAEGRNGPGWLRYVGGEVRTARRAGLPIEGVCLYPAMDYPGWDNGRHCRCGLIELSPDWRERRLDGAMMAQLAEERMLAGVLGAVPETYARLLPAAAAAT